MVKSPRRSLQPHGVHLDFAKRCPHPRPGGLGAPDLDPKLEDPSCKDPKR